MRLDNQVAIVTGGGKGIGKAISMAFAREGARVVMAARDARSMEDTAGEIRSRGGSADTIVTDVRKEDQVKSMVARVLDKYGKVDILVNNSATGGPTANLTDIDLDTWNDVMAVNITGPMLCTREILGPMMAARKGVIINVSSEGGRSGFPMRSPYAVSKRGLIALTETIAIEAGPYGIRVNCISPGRVRGDRLVNVAKDKAAAMGVTYDEAMAGMAFDISLGRFVEASEVADAAVYLASNESSGVTGDTLVVSCGKHMMH